MAPSVGWRYEILMHSYILTDTFGVGCCTSFLGLSGVSCVLRSLLGEPFLYFVHCVVCCAKRCGVLCCLTLSLSSPFCAVCLLYCACCTVLAVLCLLYCACCYVFAVLCLLFCVCYSVLAVMCLLFCACCSVPAVLCLLYCVCCSVLAVMCLLYCACCTVLAVLWWRAASGSCFQFLGCMLLDLCAGHMQYAL